MKEKRSIPGAAKTFKALRSLGYDINSSIADILDNSVTDSVGSNRIEITFDRNFEFELVVRIKDDGVGMTAVELEEAMRIGADSYYETGSLGKFGFGMKTASLAHCNILTVLSKTKNSEIVGYRWNMAHVKEKRDWILLELEENDINQILFKEGLSLGKQGTIVLWDDVFGINSEYNSHISPKLARNYLFRKTESLKLHLRMVFHRFLDRNFEDARNVAIIVNKDRPLTPWDPFCVIENATKLVPLNHTLSHLYIKNYNNPILMKAYVLPSKDNFSSDKAWREAKGLLSWNDAQGYYIYRANRLIRFGGWHGTKSKDEHDKLARLSIDVDPELDDEFKITVNKNKVEFPELLFQHLKTKVNPLVVKQAQSKYRKEPEKNKVENKLRNNNKFEQVSRNILTENKIHTKPGKDNSGFVEVHNSNGSWLSNKLNEFLKYGSSKDYEIVSDHIENGQLWKLVCDPYNKFKVIINSSHPFYTQMYKKGVDKQVTEAVDALIFSLAFGELYNRNQQNVNLFETYKTVFSSTLEKLVKEKIV
ncbi:ATP-binding protein [Mangrovibacterium lignilyticum]|uniref:ATP-binding protein n=1 Tax=Mangrovibacterium lignilyticum TaxID=2668052 RepID=UPI0013D4A7A4|nr:ATP-binding protein [Mangrovibacterium lignilyticum]